MGILDQAQQASGGAVVPELAQAAAQAGAPPAGAGAPPAEGAPAPAAAGPAPAGAAPGAAQAEAGAERKPGDPAGAVEPYLQQGDPREQEEYERAMRALSKVLYANDATANSIVDQIVPEDLVSSTSKVSMLFIKELDRKINMDEAVVAEITRESVERITELAEARHQIEYQQGDLEKILGATWEGVQSMFGNEDVEGYTQTVQGMNQQDLASLKDQQESILGQARG